MRKDFNKIYISKSRVKVLNYCKHGDLEISSMIWCKNDGSKNLCPQCAVEISNSSTHVDRSKYKEVLNTLKNPNNKISEQKLHLWYPELYGVIDRMEGKSWREKIFRFLNTIENDPICECGNPLTFDDRNNRYKKKCERCNRSNGSKIESRKRSLERWSRVLKENFGMKDPIFTVKDRYHIEIILDGKSVTMSKRNLLHLRSEGNLCGDGLILSDSQYEFYLKKFRDGWDSLKNLEESKLKERYPGIWRSLSMFGERNGITDFNEIKYLINTDKPKPTCTLCDKKTSFNKTSQCYNINCDDHKFMVYSSRAENEIYEFIKLVYPGQIVKNYRGKMGEIDMFLPEINVGIEYNGLYWHSERFKGRRDHFNKWRGCKELDIDLLTIWEDDWRDRREIIESILMSRFKKFHTSIYARMGKIREIPYSESKNFLEKNHLQGSCQSSTNIGLFYNGELISLMTFGRRKISGELMYELLRFCNRVNYSVPGASSKLFSYFTKKYGMNEPIVSYSNVDLFNGGMYEKLGFKSLGHTGENFWWVKGNKKYHRGNFTKWRLVKKGGDINKTGDMIMRENGYYKLWGSGNIKWIYQNKLI